MIRIVAIQVGTSRLISVIGIVLPEFGADNLPGTHTKIPGGRGGIVVTWPTTCFLTPAAWKEAP